MEGKKGATNQTLCEVTKHLMFLQDLYVQTGVCSFIPLGIWYGWRPSGCCADSSEEGPQPLESVHPIRGLDNQLDKKNILGGVPDSDMLMEKI